MGPGRGRSFAVAFLFASFLVLLLHAAWLLARGPDAALGGAIAPASPTVTASPVTIGSSAGAPPDATTPAPPPSRTVPDVTEETAVQSTIGSTLGDQSVTERRLALPPLAFVGEADLDAEKYQQGMAPYSGFAAFIDSYTDTLTARPGAGSSLQGVAVSPDGSRVYMTDLYEPVLHVFDTERREELRRITLPGVEARDPLALMTTLQDASRLFSYDLLAPCSDGVACTPDGAWVLVCTSAGLQVVDAATDQVVRTISDLPGGDVAVSFDGERAYVSSNDFAELSPRTYLDWLTTIAENQECRFVCIDLRRWQIVREIRTATVASVAVKPDDTQVFFSETYEKRVRVVDAFTLEDLWSVSTEPSFSVGLGFLPDGTKAYVVCSADVGSLQALERQTVPTLPQAEDFFCGVISTGEEEIVKRIPLEAY